MSKSVRTIGIAALLGLLVFVQGRALRDQFGEGYRPFGHAPTRVAWSWDMFSIPIERCTAKFDPPVEGVEGSYGSFRSFIRLPFEWDAAYNTVDDYKHYLAGPLCEQKLTQHVQLSCSTPRGPRSERVDC